MGMNDDLNISSELKLSQPSSADLVYADSILVEEVGGARVIFADLLEIRLFLLYLEVMPTHLPHNHDHDQVVNSELMIMTRMVEMPCEERDKQVACSQFLTHTMGKASPSDPENVPFVVLGSKADVDGGNSRVVCNKYLIIDYYVIREAVVI
ncbi:hypothetical protein FRX31_012049 [Thalictrum thalictroides]|uniref:Uncharacterized protein n=1 Tax=Thalictrum thalictroides TaxID=46969 RepID=A0A7J6WLY0_THATH|nr:hypothetical protein FRX31_012049 [Thalictrum thalictroides]